jgi:integrase
VPKINLTPKVVAGLQSTKREVYWDTSPLSPPRFCVRVNGLRGVYYVVIGSTWVKLGDTRGITLEDARKAARVAYGKAAAGEEPRPTQLKPDPETVTVRDLIGRYIQSRQSLSTETLKKYTYEAGKIGDTPFGKRKAGSVITQDVREYLATIDKVSVRDYRFRLLRAAFRWGTDEEVRPGQFIVLRDPTRRIQEVEPGKKKDFRLTDDDFRKVWLSVEELGLVRSTYIRMLGLLALRRGEAYKAEWSHIDLDGRTWTIPTENRKIPGRVKHLVPDLVVPLPDVAVDMLRDLKRLVGGKRPFVLSVTDVPQMTKRVSGVPGFHPHAFRKLISEKLEAAECPPHVLRLILGRVPKEYESADLFYVANKRPAEVRRWLEWWAECVSTVTRADASLTKNQ